MRTLVLLACFFVVLRARGGGLGAPLTIQAVR